MNIPLNPCATNHQLNKYTKRKYEYTKFSPQHLDKRTPFQRDRDRIMHCKSFRRLNHKTQVLPSVEGDHYRTRLIHSIEVAQIARSLAYALDLDVDLTEAIALAHDLGHTPFAHDGEKVLNKLLKPFGGFDHNAHAFRIVTEIEKEYLNTNGLNLCWATLEGLVKHNGPICTPNGKLQEKFCQEDNPTGEISKVRGSLETVFKFNANFDLSLDKFASLEAQCAAIADDIAYDAHDIDDALRASVITLDDLNELPIPSQILDNIRSKYPNAINDHPDICGKTIAREQIGLMINDVVDESKRILKEIKASCPEDIYNAGQQIIKFSNEMADIEKETKKFLYNNFYFSKKVKFKRQDIDDIITTLFNTYMTGKIGPLKTREECGQPKVSCDTQKAQIVSDYIAGMTDTHAEKKYNEIREDIK